MFKSSVKFSALALSTASLAEAGKGSQGPGVKWAGSFQKRPNNIDCDLGKSHNLCGFLILVYNMKIIIFGCLYSVNSKAICQCIFPLICSFYSFISRLYQLVGLQTKDTIKNKRENCGIHFLEGNTDNKRIYESGSNLCVWMGMEDFMMENPVFSIYGIRWIQCGLPSLAHTAWKECSQNSMTDLSGHLFS